MCSDCPILSKKLKGSRETQQGSLENLPTLYCEVCMTTEENLRSGDFLGCTNCYNVFEKLLKDKLLNEGCIPSFFQSQCVKDPESSLHRGKSPHQTISIPLSHQLTTLDNALNEALAKEHYEQAAWIRDQIKELKLKEKTSERKSSST